MFSVHYMLFLLVSSSIYCYYNSTRWRGLLWRSSMAGWMVWHFNPSGILATSPQPCGKGRFNVLKLIKCFMYQTLTCIVVFVVLVLCLCHDQNRAGGIRLSGCPYICVCIRDPILMIR